MISVAKIILPLFLVLFTPSTFGQRSLKITMQIKYTVVSNKNGSFRLVMLLPADRENLQKVDTILFSMPPRQVFTDGANKYAEFDIRNFSEKQIIIITAKMSIFRYDYSVAKKRIIVYDKEELAPYLKDEKGLEINDSTIIAAAYKALGTNEYEIVNELFLFVARTMIYNKYLIKSVGAKRALSQRCGDCTEYSDLFVALCRARHIPARVIGGLVVPLETSTGFNNYKHNWTEVYFKDFGWVPIDVLHNRLKNNFTKMENKYIYLTFVRNDINLKNINNFSYYISNNITDVSEEYKFSVE